MPSNHNNRINVSFNLLVPLKNVIPLLLILICCTQSNYKILVQSFNLEERVTIWKEHATSGSSYFGFSVAQHFNSTSDPWILVGAPLAQNLQPGTNRSGALFKCPITREHRDCVQVITDGRRVDNDYVDDDVSSTLQPPQMDEIKDNQWLGVNVRSSATSRQIVVCAHRYIQSDSLLYHHYGVGLCYVLDNDFRVTEDWQLCRGKPMDKHHQQFGLCQSGTSLSILPDGYVLVGSPGPYTWRGTIFAKEINGTFLNRDKTNYVGQLNDEKYPLEKYSYMGMSVSGGKFLQKNLTTYVSGAPHANYNGQVFFLQRSKSETLAFLSDIELRGEKFGSSFGYEVFALDIDQDGIDELLVSAPFYFEGDKLGGAVYLYKNLKRCNDNKNRNCNEPKLRLHGTIESRFGIAMTSIGDINKDGYIDVAIGAPYEETGAVYIYLGTSEGLLSANWSQKIMNKDFKALGSSLSGGYDMDNNDYPDLVVGAFESDRVVLFKTRPIVDIKIEIRGKEMLNINATKRGCRKDPRSTRTCFSFEVCCTLSKIKSGTSIALVLDVEEISPSGRSRVEYNSTNSKKSFIYNPVAPGTTCELRTLYIKTNNPDISTPIQFRASYKLLDDNPDSPILNRTSTKEFQATFQKNCGSDDICNSQLRLDIRPNLTLAEDGKYLIDLSKLTELVLEVKVTNDNESAYETYLIIDHPKGLSFVQVGKDAEHLICTPHANKTRVECKLANPLAKNKMNELQLRFEMQDLIETSFTIRAEVNTTSIDAKINTIQFIPMSLKKIANLSIKAHGTNLVFYGGEIKGETAMHYLDDVGVTVAHSYQIINEGLWLVPEFHVEIRWPLQIRSNRKDGVGKWLLYLYNFTMDWSESGSACKLDTQQLNPLHLTAENQTRSSRKRRDLARDTQDNHEDEKKTAIIDCDLNSMSAICVPIICSIKELPKNNQVTIKILSRLWNSTLVEDFNDVNYVKVLSNAAIHLKDGDLDQTLNTTAKVETKAYPQNIQQSTGVSMWIIVGAILAGLLLLIIISYLLCKIGFFKRNRVKDQTLMGNLSKPNEHDQLLNEK